MNNIEIENSINSLPISEALKKLIHEHVNFAVSNEREEWAKLLDKWEKRDENGIYGAWARAIRTRDDR